MSLTIEVVCATRTLMTPVEHCPEPPAYAIVDEGEKVGYLCEMCTPRFRRAVARHGLEAEKVLVPLADM